MTGEIQSVSVVVPVYEDPAGVRQTLESLVEQPTQREYEIVVVDNGSTDETPDVVASYASEYDAVTLAFERTVQSSYAARNEGIAASSGDLLLFVDADVTVPESWIAAVIDRVETTGADYLGCTVEVYEPGDASTLVGAYEGAVGFPVAAELRQQQFVPTCCLAVRRSVVDAIGPFRSDLVSGGDREFGERVAAAGFEQAYAPDLVVRHPARTRLRDVASKEIRVGRGQEQLRQRYAGTATTRPLYHPFNLLPPQPSGFAERTAVDVGVGRWCAYYLLSYLSKLFRVYGRVQERVIATGGVAVERDRRRTVEER